MKVLLLQIDHRKHANICFIKVCDYTLYLETSVTAETIIINVIKQELELVIHENLEVVY